MDAHEQYFLIKVVRTCSQSSIRTSVHSEIHAYCLYKILDKICNNECILQNKLTENYACLQLKFDYYAYIEGKIQSIPSNNKGA